MIAFSHGADQLVRTRWQRHFVEQTAQDGGHRARETSRRLVRISADGRAQLADQRAGQALDDRLDQIDRQRSSPLGSGGSCWRSMPVSATS